MSWNPTAAEAETERSLGLTEQPTSSTNGIIVFLFGERPCLKKYGGE